MVLVLTICKIQLEISYMFVIFLNRIITQPYLNLVSQIVIYKKLNKRNIHKNNMVIYIQVQIC